MLCRIMKILNLLTSIMSIGVKRHIIKYEELVYHPVKTLQPILISDSTFDSKLSNRGPFVAEHLVAGNKLRMSNNIVIAKNPLNQLTELNKWQKLLVKFVDFIY